MINIKNIDRGVLTVIGIGTIAVIGLVLSFTINGDFFFLTIIGLGILGGMEIDEKLNKKEVN